jgi:hypothetical protein
VAGAGRGPELTSAPPARTRLVLVLAVAAFALMGAGWALALPVNGTYDETQHLVRAYAVASGQVYAKPESAVRGGGAWFQVPRSLLPRSPDCTWRKQLSAACQQAAPDDRTRVRTGSAAGRYNPVYYAVVGLPLLVAPDTKGIAAARILSGLVGALLLGSAVAIAAMRRRPLLVAGVIAVSTPMVMNLDGAINPNGWEICAGVLLWTALLTLLRAPDGELSDRVTRLLIVACGVSGALLLTLRALGPVLLVLIVLGCIALRRRHGGVALLHRKDTQLTLAVLAAVLVYAAGWYLASGLGDTGNAVGNDAAGLPWSDALRFLLLTRLSFWIDQFVGQFSYGETTLPDWTLIAWYLLVGALVLPALALLRRRHAATLVGVAVTALLFLTVLELGFLHSIGWSQHGRYVMPLGVGFVLGAVTLRPYERKLGRLGTAKLTRVVAVAAAALQVWALLVVQTRFQYGPGRGLNPFGGGWQPVAGPAAPLVAEILGAGLLAAVAWWVSRPQAWVDPPGNIVPPEPDAAVPAVPPAEATEAPADATVSPTPAGAPIQ